MVVVGETSSAGGVESRVLVTEGRAVVEFWIGSTPFAIGGCDCEAR